MNFQNEIEQELVFKIEVKKTEGKSNGKQRRVIKLASENLKKLVSDRLDGKTGDC